MKLQIIAVAAAVFAAVPAAQAQTVDELLADHTLLRTELDRCKQMGMPSTDDTRCKTARAAEQKRFFGNGVGYTHSTPNAVLPGKEQFDPQPNSQKPQQPNSGEPHG
jgi:conjugative transfer region protein TrbK